MNTTSTECRNTAYWQERTLPLRDALELLSGKWKICIVQNLTPGALRFKDLQERVTGISPKVLSKELQDLEQNQLVTRTVNNTRPITVSYALTEHADAIQPVLDALIEFGSMHRKKIKGK